MAQAQPSGSRPVAKLVAEAGRDGDLMAALGTATIENGSAALGLHAGAEAMGLGAVTAVGLKCTFRHGFEKLLGSVCCPVLTVRIGRLRTRVRRRTLSIAQPARRAKREFRRAGRPGVVPHLCGPLHSGAGLGRRGRIVRCPSLNCQAFSHFAPYKKAGRTTHFTRFHHALCKQPGSTERRGKQGPNPVATVLVWASI
jgi:hypothetical protein